MKKSVLCYCLTLLLIPLGSIAQSDGTDAWEGAWGARAVLAGENGTELFLGGNYLEIGISNWGDYGTIGSAPDGFRGTIGSADTDFTPSIGSNQIGMSLDYDGFGRDDDNPVDYYLPGSPEERFSVGYRIGENTFAQSNSAQMGTRNMPTVVTNLSNIAQGELRGRAVSTWADTMLVTQDTFFNVNWAYYGIQITIQNISGEAWDSARYMRNVDPDNTQYRGGSYETANTVTHTIEDDGVAVVLADTANNPSDPIFLRTGSRMPFFYLCTHPGARGSTQSGLTHSNPYADYAWENPHPRGSTVNADQAIMMTVELGSFAPGEEKSFILWISLDSDNFEEVLNQVISEDSNVSNPPPPPPPPADEESTSEPVSVVETHSHTATGNTISPWTIQLDPNGILSGSASHTVLSGVVPSGLTIEGNVLKGVFRNLGIHQFSIISTDGTNSVTNSFYFRIIPPVRSPLIHSVTINGMFAPTVVISEPAHGIPAETELVNVYVKVGDPLEIILGWDFIKECDEFGGYRVVHEVLPSGLTLEQVTIDGIPTGMISGIPREEGEHIFAVSVKDWRGRGYQWFRLVFEM